MREQPASSRILLPPDVGRTKDIDRCLGRGDGTRTIPTYRSGFVRTAGNEYEYEPSAGIQTVASREVKSFAPCCTTFSLAKKSMMPLGFTHTSINNSSFGPDVDG